MSTIKKPSATPGLILLGNTGAGKSFLGNIILRYEAFKNACSPSAITNKTVFKEYEEGKQGGFSIFDVPGLNEADQSAVARNKIEIHDAFKQRPNSVVAFVFNTGGSGRIRAEDLDTFKAINKVYNFQSESLLLIVNDLPPTRLQKYDQEAAVLLEKELNLKNANVCYLDRLTDDDDGNRKEREKLRTKLLDSVVRCIARVHSRNGEINLNADRIRKLNAEAKGKQDVLKQKQTELKRNSSGSAICTGRGGNSRMKLNSSER